MRSHGVAPRWSMGQVRASATPSHCSARNAPTPQPGRHLRDGEFGASTIDTGFPHVLHVWSNGVGCMLYAASRVRHVCMVPSEYCMLPVACCGSCPLHEGRWMLHRHRYKCSAWHGAGACCRVGIEYLIILWRYDPARTPAHLNTHTCTRIQATMSTKANLRTHTTHTRTHRVAHTRTSAQAYSCTQT